MFSCSKEIVVAGSIPVKRGTERPLLLLLGQSPQVLNPMLGFTSITMHSYKTLASKAFADW